jgi:hypothetical protein
MLNEGNQIHNFISSSGSRTVINYGYGSNFLTLVPVPPVKSYGSYGSHSVPQQCGCGSGSRTRVWMTKTWKKFTAEKIDSFLSKVAIYLSLGLQPSKKNIQHFTTKFEISSIFQFLWVL